MQRMRSLLFALLAVSVSCSLSPGVSTRRLIVVGDWKTNWTPPVSLVRLISEPSVFDSQLVHVAGVLRLEYEGNALYLDKDSRSFGLLENALRLTFAPSLSLEDMKRLQKLDGRYVAVFGRFRVPDTGARANGIIEDVDSVLEIIP